jgi:hypothetical protein
VMSTGSDPSSGGRGAGRIGRERTTGVSARLRALVRAPIGQVLSDG